MPSAYQFSARTVRARYQPRSGFPRWANTDVGFFAMFQSEADGSECNVFQLGENGARKRIRLTRDGNPVVFRTADAKRSQLVRDFEGQPQLVVVYPDDVRTPGDCGYIEIYCFSPESRTLQYACDLGLPLIDEEVLRDQLGLTVFIGEPTYDVVDVLCLGDRTYMVIGEILLAGLMPIAEPKLFKRSFSILFDDAGRHAPEFMVPSRGGSDFVSDYGYDELSGTLARAWITRPGEPQMFRGRECVYYATYRFDGGWSRPLKVFSRPEPKDRNVGLCLYSVCILRGGEEGLVTWRDADGPRSYWARVYPRRRSAKILASMNLSDFPAGKQLKQSAPERAPLYLPQNLKWQELCVPTGQPFCVQRAENEWVGYVYEDSNWKQVLTKKSAPAPADCRWGVNQATGTGFVFYRREDSNGPPGDWTYRSEKVLDWAPGEQSQ